MPLSSWDTKKRYKSNSFHFDKDCQYVIQPKPQVRNMQCTGRCAPCGNFTGLYEVFAVWNQLKNDVANKYERMGKTLQYKAILHQLNVNS
jgi:hypothetical protein